MRGGAAVRSWDGEMVVSRARIRFLRPFRACHRARVRTQGCALGSNVTPLRGCKSAGAIEHRGCVAEVRSFTVAAPTTAVTRAPLLANMRRTPSPPGVRPPVSCRRAGFSMAELMIAIVILGIGLLITSSMYPIAWFKARDVAEATVVPSCSSTADASARMMLDVNPVPNTDIVFDCTDSAFFPGDWYEDLPALHRPWRASLYPDTRVHPLNMGNYLAGSLQDDELDPLVPGSKKRVVVADNGWRLDDNLKPRLGDALYVTALAATPPLSPATPNSQPPRPHWARISANARMFPPLPPRPLDDDPGLPLWKEQFELSRNCWAVFYRFSDMPGPSGSTRSTANECIDHGENPADPACVRAVREVEATLSRNRMLTMYYVTLQRPVDARYARQEGFTFTSGGGTWTRNPPNAPRAIPEAEVALPVPWRIEATLTPSTVQAIQNQVTNPSAPPTGIPSEIIVEDPVLAAMLQKETYLIDDRTGQIFRVVSRREDASGVVFTLDGEYTADDVINEPDYEPFPKTAEENWLSWWNWHDWSCEEDPGGPNCSTYQENDPAQRFYWVFPPPVESVLDGMPTFDGTPPVVQIESRQLLIRPKGG